jgi:hypothetical protein
MSKDIPTARDVTSQRNLLVAAIRRFRSFLISHPQSTIVNSILLIQDDPVI